MRFLMDHPKMRGLGSWMSRKTQARDYRGMLAPYRARRDLISEFKHHPLGPYSDSLLHLLSLLRQEPTEGKYVILQMDPKSPLRLGRLSGKRGTAPQLDRRAGSFKNRAAAEWYVFKARWKSCFNEDLE